MSRSTICINATDFKADNLVLSDCKEIKKGNLKLKISDISYLNEKNELCALYIQLEEVEAFGPFPQYDFNSKKTVNDINGYTISYSNDEACKLFKNILKICSNKFKKANIKPVFMENKKNIKTAYFKVKMNDKNIATEFYSDKKCTKSIDGLDLVRKFGSLTPMLHLKFIYFGAHGTSEYNASLQMYISKALFIKKPRLIIPELTWSDDDEEDEDDDTEEGEEDI